MAFNFASAWEALADATPNEEALITGTNVVHWGEFDDRAARIAQLLRSRGVGAGQNVGLCLYNGNEYLEAQYAAMKERCSPFNVNYRYTAEELSDLLNDADATAVFFSAEVADSFERIHRDLDAVALFVQVGEPHNVPEWAVGFDEAVATNDPASRLERDPRDLWMLFTGGTTGRPKGVMWPHDEMVGTMKTIFGGMKMAVPETPAEVVATAQTIRERGYTTRQLAGAPLMHGTAGITALSTLTQGGTVICLTGQSFDADEMWETVAERRATHLTIVGDAFSRPMVAALDQAKEAGTPYDLSSVFLIMSSGVMWSAPMKAALLEHNPSMKLLDSLGSSEGAGFASKLEGSAAEASTARFKMGPNTRVLTDDGRDVVPGSGERGRLALAGPLPIGYYKDPVKSAETWPEIDGVRYSIPGDWATVESDGSIVLLGRGSACINTGGEKVYPEEVEEALKLVDGVVDANVVGVPDERWGQAITAVIELRAGVDLDPDALKAAVREHLAAYKSPKHWVPVPKLMRAPNGKSDYRWAQATAQAALGLD